MIDMGQGSFLTPAMLAAGPVMGTVLAVAGGVANAVAPDSPAGTAGLYVGVGGIIMGVATLFGVIGDKWLPHYVQWSRIQAENQEEYRKNREARHRLANELNVARLEIEVLRKEADEAREKADRSQDLAIEAKAKLDTIEKYTIPSAQKRIRDNTERIEAVEQKSSDEILPLPLPTEPPGTTA